MEEYGILVVEDSPADATLYRQYLAKSKHNQYHLTIVSTGNEGISLMRERVFSCVILDQELPDMTASDFVGLCEVESCETPIVVITGYADPKLDKQMVRLGVADYLDKSEVTPSLLERTLLHAMERHAMMRLLRQANRSKEKFLCEVFGDLKRPLEDLFVYCDAFFQNRQNYGHPMHLWDVVEYLYDASKQQRKRMDALITRSLVDEEQRFLHLTDSQLSWLLHDVTDEYRLKAREKGLDFRVSNHPVDVQVRIDDYKLKTAYGCLLDNAVKFTKTGSILVDISVVDDTLHISVDDTGIGISGKDTDRIFSPFTHGSSSISQKFGGLGNGLAIAKQLIDVHGGKIRLVRTSPSGSHFVLSVPVAAGNTAQTSQTQLAALTAT